MARVLVTGAGGQTGDAMVSALSKAGFHVRAMVHDDTREGGVRSLGAEEVVVGDLTDRKAVAAAMQGIDSIYLICPSFAVKEEDMVGNLIASALDSGFGGFVVYHSVLHSNLTDLRHHARKLACEEALSNSGLRYAVVQPAILMQNLAKQVKVAGDTGIVPQRFYTSEGRPLAMVDLEDVAEVAVKVLSDPDAYSGGTFELVGGSLTATDVRWAFSEAVGRDVALSYVSDEAFERSFPDRLKNRRTIEEMQRMFHHYSDAGFPGSSVMLRSLLGREPTGLSEVLSREDRAPSCRGPSLSGLDESHH